MECARLAWVLPFAWRGANSYGPDRSNGNGGSDVFDAVIDKAWCASSAGRARYEDAARCGVPGAVELRRHRLIHGRPPLAEAGASDVTTTLKVLALDFDGVLCDGRPEYFEAARRAYRETWPAARDVPDAMAAAFGAHRPLVESGWEMPVLLHAVVAGEPAAGLVDRTAWLATARRLLGAGGLAPETLGQALNGVRDAWFARDPDDWVRHNVFYPGVVARLVDVLTTGTPVAVVTTKAARFARA